MPFRSDNEHLYVTEQVMVQSMWNIFVCSMFIWFHFVTFQMAAHQLHRETVRWEEQGNELVAAAKKLAVLFAKIARFMRHVFSYSRLNFFNNQFSA